MFLDKTLKVIFQYLKSVLLFSLNFLFRLKVFLKTFSNEQTNIWFLIWSSFCLGSSALDSKEKERKRNEGKIDVWDFKTCSKQWPRKPA